MSPAWHRRRSKRSDRLLESYIQGWSPRQAFAASSLPDEDSETTQAGDQPANPSHAYKEAGHVVPRSASHTGFPDPATIIYCQGICLLPLEPGVPLQHSQTRCIEANRHTGRASLAPSRREALPRAMSPASTSIPQLPSRARTLHAATKLWGTSVNAPEYSPRQFADNYHPAWRQRPLVPSESPLQKGNHEHRGSQGTRGYHRP